MEYDSAPPAPPPPLGGLAAAAAAAACRRAGDEEGDNRYVRRPLEAEMALELVPLHNCAPGTLALVNALLSERWPKGDRSSSQVARSCDAFPISLVLFEQGRRDEALGHVLLSECCEDGAGLLAESVVVASRLRGMGIGRRLMELMHDYARKKGCERVYLSTKDKRDFYLHLGYLLIAKTVSARRAACENVGTEGLDKLKAVFGGNSTGQWVWLAKELE